MVLKDALLRALKIRAGEAEKVLLMSAYLLLAVAAFISGRIARDSLFLTAFDKKDLAYMYISVAVMVPLPAYLYAKVADRFRRDRLILAALGAVIVGMLVSRVLLETKQPWVYVFFYNFVEMFGTFLVLQFWTFAGDMFSSREAKRLFPIVGLGAVIASIICGVSVSAAVRVIGTENLLWPEILFLVAGAGIILRIGKLEKTRLQEAIVQQRGTQKRGANFKVKNQVENVFASKHLKIIAGMTVATFICVPLMDYQFKVLAKETFTHDGKVDTDALSSFMGLFTTVTGVIAAVMQLALTGRILERFGVVVSLLILPVALLLAMIGMLTGVATPLPMMFGIASGTAAFGWAMFAKGAENAFRYSIYDATIQVIYTPVPGHVRGRAKTFIDGILKPAAGGLAGAAMVALIGPMKLPITSLAVVAAVLTALWIGLIRFIGREYVTQLLATLRKRRLDFSERKLVINDDATVQLLKRTLASENPAEVRNALELARRVVGHDVGAEVARLLSNPDADLRCRALEILGRSGSMAQSDAILALFDDPDDAVKAAAVRAFCAIVGEPALRVMKDRLHSPAPEVRGAAVASLIRHGGLEGILLSAEHLKEMQTSEDEAMRLAAAHVLREIGVKSFYQPVLALMRDPSTRVQSAAVQAAGAMQSPELVPALVYKLGQRDTARIAALALASYDESVIEVLAKVLAQEREEPALRRQVPRILERIGHPRCLDVLMANLGVRDPDTRREAARSAARLRDRLNARIDEARVKKLLNEEIHEHYQNLAALEDLGPVAGYQGPDLLRDAIEERLSRGLDRIFRLLSIIYPQKAIELIHGNLKSHAANTRANAIEVLDNLLDPDEKRKLLPLIEDLPRDKVIVRGADMFDLVRKPPQEWIEGFLVGRDPWLNVVALHVTAELGLSGLADKVVPHLRHADAVVRETAIRTAAVLLPTERFLEAMLALEIETAPGARRMRDWFIAEAERALGAKPPAALDAPTGAPRDSHA
jgi:ATP/ADP translocase/HEAT repeat protein